MKIVFSTARKIQQFTTIFANLKNFTENVSLYFKPTGIYIQCMDDSHCCLFECDLQAEWFAEYEFIDGEDQPSIGVNITMMNKVLGTWNDTQTLTLKLEPNQDKIAIDFEKRDEANNTHFNKYFELSLVTLDNELLDVRTTDTLVDLVVESKLFCSLIQNLLIFNDVLTLTFNEENVECVSSGTDGSMKALIEVNEVKEYAITENTQSLIQSYSLRYIQMMCRFDKLAPEIQMGFNSLIPMHMKYVLSEEGEETESFVRIHLAQKIADTD